MVNNMALSLFYRYRTAISWSAWWIMITSTAICLPFLWSSETCTLLPLPLRLAKDIEIDSLSQVGLEFHFHGILLVIT